MGDEAENKTHRECMEKIEKKIYCLLTSDDRKEVKNGLSNVLYWGYDSAIDKKTGKKKLQREQVQKFRSQVANITLERFQEVYCKYHKAPNDSLLNDIVSLYRFGLKSA